MKVDFVVAGCIFHDGKILLVHHRKSDFWLPVGGHIEKDEVPDDALLREIKEEAGIDVKILNQSRLPASGAVVRNLAAPFHVNVHTVGDHHHCCFFYICEAMNPQDIKINNELKSYMWVSRKELLETSIEHLPLDVIDIALMALGMLANRGKKD